MINKINFLKNLNSAVLNQSLKVLGAIIIIIIGFYIAKMAKAVVKKILKKASVDVSLVSFISQIVYVLVIIFAVVASLDEAGIKTTSFVAVLGALGFAIGLALQGSLSNFASGVLILIFKPFRVHDFIQGAGTSGTVYEIQVFSTILKTPDNKTIIIPNSKLTTDIVINFNLQDKRRIDFMFGISYESNIATAKNIIKDIFDKEELILEEPKSIIGVENFGDSVVNIAARPWVKTEDYWDVYYRLMEKIKVEFDNNNIQLSYPSRVIYHKQINIE